MPTPANHDERATRSPRADDGGTAHRGGRDADSPFRRRRIKKAYEQVADQLQELILDGALSVGTRLPNETVLSQQFGVSRTTVREALRLLTAQNLVRTERGASGGSFVTMPTVDHIAEFVNANMLLLSEAQHVSLDEFLEARQLLEVPAARLAAERGKEEDFEALEAAIPSDPLRLDTSEQFANNRDFHSTLVETSRNALLVVSAQPVFSVLQTNLARSVLDSAFHAEVNRQHVDLVAAVRSGEGDRAAELMYDHLVYLRPFYEKAWKHARREAEAESVHITRRRGTA